MPAIREHATSFKYLIAVPPTALAGADLTGANVDTDGYDSVTLAVALGAQASVSGASFYVLRLQHADPSAAGPSNWVDCASTDMVRFGTYISVAVTSGIWFSVDTTAVSGTVQYVAYRGSRQYVRLIVDRRGSTFSLGCLVGAVAILGHPAQWPVVVGSTGVGGALGL